MDVPPPAVAPRSRRPWWIAAAAVVVLAVAVGLVLATRSHPAAHRHPRALPPAPPTSAPAPATSPAPPPPPRPPHQHVRPAAPVRFAVYGPAFRIRAHVCGMAAVFPLDPPGEQHHTVCWVDHGFGVAPGSDTATTYVLGHAWAEDSQEVLNKLSSRAMKQVLHEVAQHQVRMVDSVPTRPITNLDGYHLVLHTPAGTLRYVVRSAWAAPKPVAGYVHSVMNQKVPHRLVLITCGERNGTDYDYNIVVNAFLVSSVASRA